MNYHQMNKRFGHIENELADLKKRLEQIENSKGKKNADTGKSPCEYFNG